MELINYQLGRWDLSDRMRNTHFDMLDSRVEIGEEEMKEYAELMELRMTHNIRRSLQIGLMTEIERIAIHSFVSAVLFLGERDGSKGGEILPAPAIDEILKNTWSHYFLAVGEITIKSLCDKYCKFELLCLLTMLSDLTGEKIDPRGSCLNIAGEIVNTIEDSTSFDHRTVLTFNGPIQAHQVMDDNNINLDVLPGIDMDYVCNNLGISLDLPGSTKLNKVIFFQFIPNFYRNVEWCRSKPECLVNEYDSNQQHYTTVEGVYFGVGTGDKKYRFYSVPELTGLWKEIGRFYDPRTKGFFHDEAIRTLWDVCGYLKGGDELRDVIDTLRGKKVGTLQPENWVAPKKFTFYHLEQDTLYDIYELGCMMCDASSRFQARYDQSVRERIREKILSLATKDELSLFYVMDFVGETNVVFPSLSWTSTLSFHLHVYLSLLRFGLLDTLQHFGTSLLITANEYHKKLYDEDIVKKINVTLESEVWK